MFFKYPTSVRIWRGYIVLLLKGLRKLPRWFSANSQPLYRGITVPVSRERYAEGNTVTWPAITSTSLKMAVVLDFITNPSTKNPRGTIFIITGAWGYDIQKYSWIKKEQEILLEPDRKFTVKSVMALGDVLQVQLEMQDTPLLDIDGGAPPAHQEPAPAAPPGSPARSKGKTAKFCTKCGHPRNPEDNFCADCGKPF
eukprot:TRINITY_DN1804_c0_g1_i5.p1 TRINITY_DN1804_c0_g1~~TRINITY_DN1804_c0_g1_i5.p1  ORF type:complete len:197 (+),score=50.27 TRINITY_DN1804_c0_g1_i5:289-879(+)